MTVVLGSTYSGYQEIIAYFEADREPAVSEFYLMRKCNVSGNKSHIKGLHGDSARSRTKKIEVESSKSWMPTRLIRSVPFQLHLQIFAKIKIYIHLHIMKLEWNLIEFACK